MNFTTYDLYPVVFAYCRPVSVGEQSGQFPVIFPDLLFCLFPEKKFFYPRVGVSVESVEECLVFPEIICRVAHIQPEYNVQYDPDSRKQGDDKDPGHLFPGIAVAAQDHEYCPAYQQYQHYRPDDGQGLAHFVVQVISRLCLLRIWLSVSGKSGQQCGGCA